jgi:hypothetical protein
MKMIARGGKLALVMSPDNLTQIVREEKRTSYV